MAIRVSHAASPGLAGLTSLLGGLGQYQQKQQERADQRDRFMRQLQEQSRQFNVEQALRQQQMALEAEMQKARMLQQREQFQGQMGLRRAEMAQRGYLREQEMDTRVAMQQRQAAQQAAMQGQRLQAGLIGQQMGQQGQMARQQQGMMGQAQMQQMEDARRAQAMLQEQRFEQGMAHDRQEQELMLRQWDMINKTRDTRTPDQQADVERQFHERFGQRENMPFMQKAPKSPMEIANDRTAQWLEEQTGMPFARDENGAPERRNTGFEQMARHFPMPGAGGKSIAQIEHEYQMEEARLKAEMKPERRDPEQDLSPEDLKRMYELEYQLEDAKGQLKRTEEDPEGYDKEGPARERLKGIQSELAALKAGISPPKKDTEGETPEAPAEESGSVMIAALAHWLEQKQRYIDEQRTKGKTMEEASDEYDRNHPIMKDVYKNLPEIREYLKTKEATTSMMNFPQTTKTALLASAQEGWKAVLEGLYG